MLPTLPARPLTRATVLVSAASGSVSLVSTLPAALGVPGMATLPAPVPLSVTLLLSATPTGGLLAPTVTVSVPVTKAPVASVRV